jgi:hypothetical protein
MRRADRLAALAFVLVAACHTGKGASGPSGGHTVGPPSLAFVPADTPYALVGLESPSDAVMNRMLAPARDTMKQSVAQLDALGPDVDRSKLPVVARVGVALADELKGKDLDHWFEALGFDPHGRVVIYGLSLWPVMRLEIKDAARVHEVASKLIAAADLPTEEKAVGGQKYWLITIDGGMSAVVAVLDHEIVGALLPADAVDGTLPLVLGQKKPAHSLADAGTLQAIARQHGFSNLLVGFVDVNAVDGILAGRADGPNDALASPLRAALGPVSPACRDDRARLIAFAPRVAIGYRRLDEQGFDVALVLETPPGVAKALDRVRAAVPDVAMPAPGNPLLALGLAANVDQLLPLVRDVAGLIKMHPFSCPSLADLNDAANGVYAALGQPLPPFLQGLKGFALVIDDMTVSPPSGSGHLLIVGDHVTDLVPMLLGNLPGMAGVQVKADGLPVALPVASFGVPGLDSAHIAMRADRVALAVGAGSAARAVDVLAAPAPARSPLFMYAMDAERFNQRVGAAVGVSALQEGFQNAQGATSFTIGLEPTDTGLSIEIVGAWKAEP